MSHSVFLVRFFSSLEEMNFHRDRLPFKELRFEEPPHYMLQ